jgi:hypothetical protein
MDIDFESSGGFANLSLKYHARTEELPPELTEELRGLVEQANVFQLDDESLRPKGSGPPDVISYRLTVEDGLHRKSLSFNDVTAPASLRPLLAQLRKLAIEAAGSKG